MEPLLSVSELESWYGKKHILRRISFEVAAGEVVAILGPNGAGKSTVLGAVAGTIPARASRLALHGVDLRPMRPFARARLGVASLLQGGRVFPSLTVKSNLELAAHGTRAGAGHDILTETFELFPALEPLVARRSSLLSGGERQQLSVAMVLLHKRSSLVLLDEPCAGLAPHAADMVLDRIFFRSRRAGSAVVLVEQSVSRALNVAQRVLILRGGEIVLESPSAGLDADAILQAFAGSDRALPSLETRASLDVTSKVD